MHILIYTNLKCFRTYQIDFSDFVKNPQFRWLSWPPKETQHLNKHFSPKQNTKPLYNLLSDGLTILNREVKFNHFVLFLRVLTHFVCGIYRLVGNDSITVTYNCIKLPLKQYVFSSAFSIVHIRTSYFYISLMCRDFFLLVYVHDHDILCHYHFHIILWIIVIL